MASPLASSAPVLSPEKKQGLPVRDRPGGFTLTSSPGVLRSGRSKAMASPNSRTRFQPSRRGEGGTRVRMRWRIFLLVALLLASGLEACATFRGLGEDIQKLGKKMEDKASR